MTASLDHVVMPKVGAHFFRADDGVMFQFVIDPGNVIGPRPATKPDSEKYPEEWARFLADNIEPEPPPAVVQPLPVEPEEIATAAVVEGGDPTPPAETVEERVKRKYTRREAA